MTSPLYDQIHSCLPKGWALSNLIFLDPDWQVNIADDEGVVVATGDFIEEALTNAQAKALEGKYVGKFKIERAIGLSPLTNLAERLGLVTRPTIARR